ncbi:MAG: hypothetical protein EON53_04810 [Actinomycetales bacterium]|nr:MAG: hypothetical protein EON53_04810 [Actinomycetales bacterium]
MTHDRCTQSDLAPARAPGSRSVSVPAARRSVVRHRVGLDVAVVELDHLGLSAALAVRRTGHQVRLVPTVAMVEAVAGSSESPAGPRWVS